jgi:nucleotide-binding universal stress UspA family protein
MYRVLVALDTDRERALAQADAVASLPGATEEVAAVLLHVFQDNPEGQSAPRLDGVRHAAAVLDEHDIDYEYGETSGDPTTEILAAADDRDVDLLCLSGRRRTPAGKAIFGSVTQSVILEADRPVITVSPE